MVSLVRQVALPVAWLAGQERREGCQEGVLAGCREDLVVLHLLMGAAC